ncbi:lipase member H-like [Episyrphus balteatus]|uniref:lipase member H-like n=1 Tax=Episyrphus balteatus TaxID=286459 RepID=UPI0024850B9D|nr:lipase member H-like [Episyrphus balteatus]
MFAEKTLMVFVLRIFLTNILLQAIPLPDDNADVDTVKIMFFYGPKFENYTEYNLTDAASLLKDPKFIHNQTHLYMTGYRTWEESPAVIVMAESYLKRNNTNFLNLEWGKMAAGTYISAQINILKLSPYVADFIIDLFKLGLPQDSFTMSGTSIGGRGAGLFGRDVIERSNGTMIVSRISPFDPSNEEAHDEFILPDIDKSYAKFVDVHYSDAGGVGTEKLMGHVHFWPNNGTRFQPGCPSDGTEC